MGSDGGLFDADGWDLDAEDAEEATGDPWALQVEAAEKQRTRDLEMWDPEGEAYAKRKKELAAAAAAAAEERAAREAAAAERRAAEKAAAARRAYRIAQRTRELLAQGLPKERAEALAVIRGGPYDVVLHGATPEHNPTEISDLLRKLGYGRSQARRAILRSTHIAPEVVALCLHESAAIQLKVALEKAGARARIRAHT